MIEEYLSQCEKMDLIRRVQGTPELEFWFRHVLVQEAAYDSLLKSTRADLHRRVARAIEAQAGDGLESEAGLLALHYEQAGLLGKSFPYAIKAAEQASRTYAHEEAVRYYDRALYMAERLDDRRLDEAVQKVCADRGAVLETVHDWPAAVENYRGMLKKAQERGVISAQADATVRLATLLAVIDPKAAELPALLESALALAETTVDRNLIGRARWTMGLYYRWSEPRRAIRLWQEALALVEAEQDGSVQSKALLASVSLDLTVGMLVTGRVRQAVIFAGRAAEINRALGNLRMLADALGHLANLAYLKGEVARARTTSDEAYQISQTIGNSWGIVFSDWGRVGLELDGGAFETVLDRAEQRMERAYAVGFPVFIGVAHMNHAHALLELGQPDVAAKAIDQAVGAFKLLAGTPVWSVWSAGMLGEGLLAKGQMAAAHEQMAEAWKPGGDYEEAIEGFMVFGGAFAELARREGRFDDGLAFCDWLVDWWEREGTIRLAGEMRYQRGLLHFAAGHLPEAGDDLSTALRELTACEAPRLLWQVEAALAELHEVQDVADAGDHMAASVKILGDLLAQISRPDNRRSFLARDDVRAVLARAEAAGVAPIPAM